jgi:hypothetical protein
LRLIHDQQADAVIGSLVIEWPPIMASPPVGMKRVESIEMAVVLPAPLGPSKLKISPSLISNEIPFTAVKSPNFLTRFLTSRMGVMDRLLVKSY